MRTVTSLTGTGSGVGCENKLVGVGPSHTSVVGLFYKPTWLGVERVRSVLFEQRAAGMEGPTRPGFQKGDGASAGKEVEEDYFLRIMRSLTESSTTSQAAPVPSQSTEEESGIGSRSYSFSDSYGRIPDISPGLNPWSYFPPPPELRGLVVVSSEPSWTSTMGSPPVLSPIQQEILADFPWLNDELDIHRRLMNSAGAAPASSCEVSFPRLTTSKEESDACTSVCALEPSIETHTTDQVEWAQSMLELQAFENSTIPDESAPATRDSSKWQRISNRAASHLHDRSSSLTPANSETPFNSESLSSSLSDGVAEPNKDSRRDGEDAACTSAQSEKRKRTDAEQEDGEDAPSDDQETKKPIKRPRKKGVMKRVREPRYAIKTMTDTEVMDDGYKWRKYGQKAVKNSPHPRNYYRCTTQNCPVRKRVERCFEDPGLVVTTYEGTHTHKSPSFLRGPPDYPGGLQALLATLTHHYTLAGNAPLPPFSPHSASGVRSPGPLSSSELYRSSSPSWLSQPQSQGAIQENLNRLRSHEQLQQEADRAFSLSNVTSLSNLSYDSRMSHYGSLTNSSVSEQLAGGGSGQLTSSTHSARPFTSVLQQPFGRRPDQYVTDSAVPRDDEFRAGPSCNQDSSGASKDHRGLLEDMFRPTNPSISRA